jgi:outer membrane protein, heavy metal efflux system
MTTVAAPTVLPGAVPWLAGGPLTLEQLVQLAVQNHPDVAIALARVEAARGRLIQAGLYPNPTFSWDADDVNSALGRSGTEGPVITQQIVTAHKIKIAKAAAAQGVAAADWVAMTRWYDVVTRVRLAYFELLTAQQNLETTEEIVRISQQALDAARKLLKAGAGIAPDVIRAEVELRQNQVLLVAARERLAAAWRLLLVAIGNPDLPPTPVAGTLEMPVPPFDWEPVYRGVLTRSSEVLEAQANVLQAEELVKLARAQVRPNVQLLYRPFYNEPDGSMEMQAQVGFAVPIFDRNQGNILSARADVARLSQELRLVELRLTERLTLAYQRYLTARETVDIYARQLLPNARESLRLILLGYEKGDAKFDYTAVLQAQRILYQVQLAYVQALGELWRAVSEIAGLLQLDDFRTNCFGSVESSHEPELGPPPRPLVP